MELYRFQGFDISLAVYAHATLRPREPTAKESTATERDLLVWQPMKRFMSSVVTLNPQEIVCFHNGIYEYPTDSGGECTDVYFVRQDKVIAYMGTVFSQQAEQAHREKWVEIYHLANRPDLAQLLLEREPTTIMMDRWFCRIPTVATHLSEEAVTAAVRHFLSRIAPTVAELPLQWWPELQSEAFIYEIDALATQLTRQHRQTSEEQYRTIMADEFQIL